jgi:hypothetical protein
MTKTSSHSLRPAEVKRKADLMGSGLRTLIHPNGCLSPQTRKARLREAKTVSGGLTAGRTEPKLGGEPGGLTLRSCSVTPACLAWQEAGPGASMGRGSLGRWVGGYLLIVLQLVVQDHTVGLVRLRPRQGDAVHRAAHLMHDGHGRWR